MIGNNSEFKGNDQRSWRKKGGSKGVESKKVLPSTGAGTSTGAGLGSSRIHTKPKTV